MYKCKLIITLILTTFLVACGPSTSKQLEANKNLIHRFTTSTNAADWDAFDELLTEDFSRHCQATPNVQVNSREEFKKLQESFLVSMPDQQITIEMIIAEGDKVAVYATYSGTLTGPMGEFPPTGKSVESKFISIFRIEEGRIAELWVEWDNLAMFTQLGLFPPGAQGTY
jgi:steroid delta-isomerase-like uncharacterized protein